MKTATNCDETFDRLTAGRLDGNDETTRAIRAHLRECDSCRGIADALRPALHLIHEALPQEERDGLPTYVPDDDVAERIMQHVRSASRSDHQASKGVGFRGSKSVWSIVAFAAAVLAISWFQTSAVEPTAEQVPAITKADLASACFALSRPDASDVSSVPQRAIDCCTKCHVATSDLRISKAGMRKVAIACQQCHVDI